MSLLVILLAGITSTTPALEGDARSLADGCIADGQDKEQCECYAGFVAENTSARELEALTVLTDPKYRDSMQSALKALTAKGLTPSDLFSMAMRADALQDKAKARCEPESEQH